LQSEERRAAEATQKEEKPIERNYERQTESEEK
jgi:hypothetical protein